MKKAYGTSIKLFAEMEKKMSEVIKLGKYKGLSIQRPEAVVSEEEKQEAYARRQRTFAESTEVDRPAKETDIVNIDFVGYMDGTPFEGSSGEDYALEIGSGTFIPGFEEQLAGASKGDEVDVDITFPADYAAAHLAGKSAVFKVKINSVTEQTFPPLTKTVIKEIDDSLKMYKERETEELFESMLTEAIVADSEIEVSDDLLEREITELLQTWKARIMMTGVDPEKYYEATGTSEEEIRVMLREDALDRAKSRLVLEKIAEIEGLKATKAAKMIYINRMATQYGIPEEEVENALTQEHLDAIESDVRIRKALQLIKDNMAAE